MLVKCQREAPCLEAREEAREEAMVGATAGGEQAPMAEATRTVAGDH